MVNILIGGDICPMGRIQNAFIEGKAYQIFNDLLEDIASADLSIANLECPLIISETPIIKPGSPGSILGADSRCIRGFVASNWDVLNFANNHSFDHGAIGLIETIKTIKGAGLEVVGAGENLKEAQKPFVKEINGERIVIYAMAEREYSIADEKTPGANPLDLINFVNAVRLYKQEGIFIVLIHGGKEYYPYPSPEMVRRCRFMVDMGADAVICCHTHLPLPWEIYADRPIVYGLGNLVFEARKVVEDGWFQGYLVKLTIEERQSYLEIIPYFQSQTGKGTVKMHEPARMHFLDEMQRKNAQLKDIDFLQDQWTKHCQQQKEAYLVQLFGYNRYMKKVRNLLLRRLHSKKEVLRALHLAQCETHRESLNRIFRCERNGESFGGDEK